MGVNVQLRVQLQLLSHVSLSLQPTGLTSMLHSTRRDVRIVCLMSEEAHEVLQASSALRLVMTRLKYAVCHSSYTCDSPVHVHTHEMSCTPPTHHTRTHSQVTNIAEGNGGGPVWTEVQDAACVL